MVSFENFNEFLEVLAEAPTPDDEVRVAAESRNSQLTKPAGSLGRLEDLAIWYASWRGIVKPEIIHPQVIIFAGNHGVAKRGVSAFPAEVTLQMVENFKIGGAAINQLAMVAGARLDVHALSLEKPTRDFTEAPAMDEEECIDALKLGWSSVHADTDLLVVGEMGIGNTTAAAAIIYIIHGGMAADWVGRGTGITDVALEAKLAVVESAASKHRGGNGLETLARVGGREIAAMVGAIARARMERIPVILDGFICSVAAACLMQVKPDALDHVVAGHVSAEEGHRRLLTALNLEPILFLGMRLGEGSGAAVAINILRSAVACYSGMATFAEAGVATK
ncbi:MAG: nicotinate-nucleotide--dimethylbenzimidazole phosphoribosyltransferase [Aestuariivita sp.]|nr:nicotinate-nucleotide--dimethylbenzimidazole phosphoribosyltransferase [Aestuariivita sp.]MCY4202386.1 nicotinate-nucleotide--dimethylbenzimidazole phosphoribosyltransferase [Aestuariivita sp.]MCY4288675.1 nicotinate-nucleotide--dimethylbenzimidazole phosphoribosyltransferase [Aestuariivita sp.]MCY4345554.1 nicotinate-nucleotide--dimethylbenzimidazole phosphoribosyltransferase [Aestuariivita sp.]